MPRTSIVIRDSSDKRRRTYGGVRMYDLLERAGAPLGKELYGVALQTSIVASGYPASTIPPSIPTSVIETCRGLSFQSLAPGFILTGESRQSGHWPPPTVMSALLQCSNT